MKILFKKLLALKQSEHGNVLILISVALWVLIAAAGVAIDMSRLQTIREDLHECLDTAGLAAMTKIGAKPFNMTASQWVTQVVNEYFYADCAQGAFKTQVAITPVLTNNNNTLTLTLTSRQPALLMPVVGIKDLNVQVKSVITRAVTGAEIALVLDNTYSMKDPVAPNNSPINKITAVKCSVAGEAAFGGGNICQRDNLPTVGLLDIIYGSSNTVNNLYIGVVPFSNLVNIDPHRNPGSRFIDNYNGSMWYCLDSRNPNTRSTADANISLPSGRAVTLDIGEDRPSSPSTYFKALPYEAPDYCGANASYCPAAEVLPMTTLKSDVVNTVKNMGTGGNTMINIGLAWGWRMLSPEWTGMWGAAPTYTYPSGSTVSLPLPYNTTGMQKVLILMTDGMNMNGTNPRTRPQPWCNHNTNTDNSYEDQPRMPTNDQLDGLTEDVCDAMKKRGITIYTIGFGVGIYNTPTVAQRDAVPSILVDVPLLKYCASGADHFFLAPTNDQLAAAFQTIANQLVNIRVAQ